MQTLRWQLERTTAERDRLSETLKTERQAKHAAAGLPDMEVLFDEVMLKAEDGSSSKVATLVQFAEPLQGSGAIRRNSAHFGAQFSEPPHPRVAPRPDRGGGAEGSRAGES